jgi:hypothetical protein
MPGKMQREVTRREGEGTTNEKDVSTGECKGSNDGRKTAYIRYCYWLLEQHGVYNYNMIRYDTKRNETIRDEGSNDGSPLANRHPLPSHSQHIPLSLDLIFLFFKTW